MFNIASWIENITDINLEPQTMIFIALGVAIVTLFLIFIFIVVGAKSKPETEKELDEQIEKAFDEEPIPVTGQVVDPVFESIMELSEEPQLDRQEYVVDEPILEMNSITMGLNTVVDEIKEFDNNPMDFESSTMALDDVVSSINENQYTQLEEETDVYVKEESAFDLIGDYPDEITENQDLSFDYDEKPFELINEDSLAKPALPQIFSSVYLEPRERELAMTRSMKPVTGEEELEVETPVVPSWPFIKEMPAEPEFEALSKYTREPKEDVNILPDFDPEESAPEPALAVVEETPVLEPESPTLTADIIRERLMQLQHVKETAKAANESDELENILKQVGLNGEEAPELNKEEKTMFR